MATKNKKRRYLSVASNDGTSPKKTAVTQLVPNPFDPRTSGPPLPVPLDKGSPENLSVASKEGNSPKKTKAAMMTSLECPGKIFLQNFFKKISNYFCNFAQNV